ncbi:MAG: histidine kinase [Deltaproteobacteria bacterium]|nr:histidine kinase [Deltaproteobacteria bacterium]
MVWPRTSLQVRTLVIVAALTLLCLGGGLISLWYAIQMNSFFHSMVDQELTALHATEEVNAALVMQKGYGTYFFQDNNPAWLKELEKCDLNFKTWLARARQLTRLQSEQDLLNRIESGYLSLAFLRSQVIDHYQNGEQDQGFQLHQEARGDFFKILELTKKYKTARRNRINRAREAILVRAAQLKKLSLAGVASAIFLGALLAFVLVRQVLGPIRRLALETDPARTKAGRLDEVQALSDGVRHLIEDVDATKSQLQLSREHLIQASKLASVGKLAAGMAHSIRNPLTSVNMRLFSLKRNLELSDLQREDFEVISEEIRHIDNIVRNFLEFSRPPKLQFQRISLSEVVDGTLGLLRHRLESFGVEVEVVRPDLLPEMKADSEQLKEVLVNLIVNAWSATTDPAFPQRSRTPSFILFSRPRMRAPASV